ncbi:uncharacterized protein LOC110266377 [Arachis ipaensis]|uniref:uncharacterized protein LOC110266377 n=1 Tax=Arachis ipaensis TaxID=130454 RepID=UPI000A2B995D|nr:uncharacterized protein LOC110266377 [Arachis ipaensis]
MQYEEWSTRYEDMFPSKPCTVASQQRNLREEVAAVAFVLHGHAENVQAIADDVFESTNHRDATILRGSSIPSKAPTLPLEILTVAVDSEENNPPQPLTALVLKGRMLFHSPDGRCTGSAPTKRLRAATACSTMRKVAKTRSKFKATHEWISIVRIPCYSTIYSRMDIQMRKPLSECPISTHKATYSNVDTWTTYRWEGC